MTVRYLEQRLKLSSLRMMDALASHRSLLRASSVLGVTQPALTKNLQELEEQVGAQLFDRHARGVQPTEAGLLFIQSARRMLAETRRLDEELDLLASPGGGLLSIGALPIAAAGVLPGVLTRLRSQQPNLKVRLREGRTENLLPLLAAGEIDLVVGRLYEPIIPDGLSREPLWDEPISLVAGTGHPVFGTAITPQGLARYDMILPTVTQRVGQDVEHALDLLGVDGSRALRSSSYGLIREMLLAADMVAVVPSLMMLGDIERGTLQIARLPVTVPSRPSGLVTRKEGPRMAAAYIFIETLRRYAAEFSSGRSDKI